MGVGLGENSPDHVRLYLSGGSPWRTDQEVCRLGHKSWKGIPGILKPSGHQQKLSEGGHMLEPRPAQPAGPAAPRSLLGCDSPAAGLGRDAACMPSGHCACFSKQQRLPELLPVSPSVQSPLFPSAYVQLGLLCQDTRVQSPENSLSHQTQIGQALQYSLASWIQSCTLTGQRPGIPGRKEDLNAGNSFLSKTMLQPG